jgi:type IV pilus assembly protein PilW
MLNHISPRSQRGINLVELMVGIAISLVLLTGVLSVMLRISASGGEVVASTRLNQQMRGAVDLMTKELQRSGYVNWFKAWDTCDGSEEDDIFADKHEDGRVDILDYYECVSPVINDMGRVEVNGSCILYSYDFDKNGGKGTGDFESFGFRLNDGAIEMRTAGDGHACNTGTWQDVTDSSVTITSLTFTLAYVNDASAGDAAMYSYTVGTDPSWSESPTTVCTPAVAGTLPEDDDVLCLVRRGVQIQVEGQLTADAAVTMALDTKVKLKNDHFNTATPAP